MAWLHNRYSEKTFTIKDTIVVWWAGMMRGAVSVAMVYYRFDPRNEKDDKHAATIVVTTLQLVLYSTVGLGGLTGPLLKCLLPQQVHHHELPHLFMQLHHHEQHFAHLNMFCSPISSVLLGSMFILCHCLWEYAIRCISTACFDSQARTPQTDRNVFDARWL
jgi:hypothetical protein